MRASRHHADSTPYEEKHRLRRWVWWPLSMAIWGVLGYFIWMWFWALGWDPSSDVKAALNVTFGAPLAVGVSWMLLAAAESEDFMEYR